ncbi:MULTISPECIES: hypothetical protein [Kitasatospora]|uniref:Uncharacterized protein n=1 Tax=Kitasatospora setae (strain ATCC 33774 / DSM 43861 / JCM 3304 / KCC A-0304 / NBRC 14216 / KM-6054) TaxID=452652 RepID=E4N392_KITSK|nr:MULTISPECIES: hypothetical protein [Kitasatospora]BAJ32626.1 hypothetical protein KSE_68680 [Kitasatospora setae KM-6054]
MTEHATTETPQPRPFPDRQAVLRAAVLVPVTPAHLHDTHPHGPLALAATEPVDVRTGGLAWDETTRRLTAHPAPGQVVGARIEILTVGEHPLGHAVKEPGGEVRWPAWAALGDTPVAWHGQPALLTDGGSYPCLLNLTGEQRALLVQAEGEHGLDFNEALLRVTRPLAEALDQLPDGLDRTEALGRLITLLIDRGARYLVPADPHHLPGWEPHLHRAYRALDAQARARRHEHPTPATAPHRPVRYDALVRDGGAGGDGGDGRDGGGPEIVLTPVLRRGGQWLAAMDPAALDLPHYRGGGW